MLKIVSSRRSFHRFKQVEKDGVTKKKNKLKKIKKVLVRIVVVSFGLYISRNYPYKHSFPKILMFSTARKNNVYSKQEKIYNCTYKLLTNDYCLLSVGGNHKFGLRPFVE